jgi:hypothetical protein
VQAYKTVMSGKESKWKRLERQESHRPRLNTGEKKKCADETGKTVKADERDKQHKKEQADEAGKTG